MSQILTGNDDNRSVAASDFVQLNQPYEVSDQEAQQQQEQPQNTGSTRNYDNELKEQKLMIANLEVFFRFWAGTFHRYIMEKESFNLPRKSDITQNEIDFWVCSIFGQNLINKL
jgi:hypothetical protein